jgi:hypothetical protein
MKCSALPADSPRKSPKSTQFGHLSERTSLVIGDIVENDFALSFGGLRDWLLKRNEIFGRITRLILARLSSGILKLTNVAA